MSEPKTLYVVVCAAGPAEQVDRLITPALEQGWQVQVIATPTALDFFDPRSVKELTGRPVRSQYCAPDMPRSPKADAVIVAPASFNTINKLANGTADNYALDVLNEGIGLRLPLVVLPFVNSAYAQRLPFRRSIASLREEGARVLLGEGEFVPHPPGQGGDVFDSFPWQQALSAVAEQIPGTTD